MENHKIMVICRRVLETPIPGEGAEKDVCEKCSSEIWVSKKSFERKRELGAYFFCAACAMEIVKDQEHLVLGTERQFKAMNECPSVQGKGQFIPAVRTDANPDKILRMAKDGATTEELAQEIHPPPERN